MFGRPSITANHRELGVLACLILLVGVAPAGHEATQPAVLFLYRTLLLAIIGAYVAWTDRSKLPRLCPYFVGTLAACFGIMLISVLRWPGSSVEGFFTFYQTALFVTAFVVLAHAGAARTPKWKHTVLAAVVLINLSYLAAAMWMGTRPLIGTFVNPNYLASFLLPGLAVCAAVVTLGVSLPLRVGAAAAGVFIYYGIGLTSSRGVTLAGLVLLGLASLRAARRFGVSWARTFLAVALLATITLAANPRLVRKFLDRGERDPYNYQRGQIWLGTLSMIAQHPVAGVGVGRYFYIAKRYSPAVEGTIARYRQWPNIAHSEYLQYAAEIGIPGAMLFFSAGGYVLWLAWRRAKNTAPENRLVQEAALLTAVGLGFHALVDNNWTVPVTAAGVAVISQADLLPYRAGFRVRFKSSQGRTAVAILLTAIWVQAALVPATAFHFNDVGHEAYNFGDLDRAESNHRFALGFTPDHPVLLDNLGMVYFDRFMKDRRVQDLDRAERLFSTAITRNPYLESAASNLERTLVLRLTGDPRRDAPIHKRIVETDRRVLEANPFNAFSRKNLAEGLYNMGEAKQARAELLRAVEIEPNFVPGFLRLAEWSEEMGRPEEGEKFRREAIRVVSLYKDKRSLDPFEEQILGRPRKAPKKP